jgi:hypothetical protein
MNALHMLQLMKTLIVILAAVVIIPFTACTAPSMTPEEVIAKSKTAMENLRTYRMEMTGSSTLDGEIHETILSTEFVSPDRRYEVETYDGISAEAITIGQTQYRRDSGTENWETIEPEKVITQNTSFATLVFEPVHPLTGVVQLAYERIDGVDCFHYKGDEDMEAGIEKQKAELDPSSPGYDMLVKSIEVQRNWKIVVEYWIGKDDFLLRQMKQDSDIVNVDYAGQENETENHVFVTYTIRFFDFNTDIKIEPPLNIVEVYGTP